MVLAEKDYIVNNRASKAWRDKNKSKIKMLKLIPGAYHELAKEPNNDVLFESALNFMGQRLSGSGSESAKPFGEFKHSLVKYWQPRPMKKRFKLLIIVALYVLIGLLFAIVRRRKNMIISWPRNLLHRK